MARKIKTVKKTSFQRGWMSVTQESASTVRAKIMFALGITTLQSFRDRMNGRVWHNDAEIEKIEAIFKEYGITKTKVWGRVR
jgi:hypothetical protein